MITRKHMVCKSLSKGTGCEWKYISLIVQPTYGKMCYSKSYFYSLVLSNVQRRSPFMRKCLLYWVKSFHDLWWCEPRDPVVTQPTIKIEIWSRKTEIDLIGVWHNGNLPQGTNTIGLRRMTPRSQLIFDKSDSVRSRTEECKNHSHTLKLKNSEVIIIKAAEILAYMSLNCSWKINPNGPLMWTYMRSTQNWSKTLNWKSPLLNPNKPWILTENKVLIKPKQALGYL
jgi:hypothetical protein